MSDELITVWRGPNSEQAESHRRMLEGRGVEAFVAPCETEMGEWTLLASPENASRVRRFIERAEELEQSEGQSADDDVLDDRLWRQWPKCAECDAPKITRCQFCGSEGSDFPVADGAPVETDAVAVLLCCAICDEPFEPEFYRRCAECGEDFGEGIDVPASGDPDLANPRVHLMLGTLVAVGVLGFLYYLFLFG